MHFLTTILLFIFSAGCLIGFYIVISMFLEKIKAWKVIYFICLILVFFLAKYVAPEDYESPFHEEEATIEDYEKGYRDHDDEEQYHLP